jgi:hypothetical protein
MATRGLSLVAIVFGKNKIFEEFCQAEALIRPGDYQGQIYLFLKKNTCQS